MSNVLDQPQSPSTPLVSALSCSLSNSTPHSPPLSYGHERASSRSRGCLYAAGAVGACVLHDAAKMRALLRLCGRLAGVRGRSIVEEPPTGRGDRQRVCLTPLPPLLPL
jgi:hypothetical protein